MNAQPHRLLLFFDILIPSGLSEFQERFEVGLVSQATPVILIDKSPVVGSDLHMPRSGALRVTKQLTEDLIDVACESALDAEPQARRVDQIVDL
jgi:hypothetical protein